MGTKQIKIAIFACTLVALSAISHANTISRSTLVYLGAFRVPQGEFGESSFSSNPFVNAQYQPMAYNPGTNSLFFGQSTPSHSQTKRLGELSIPQIINPLDVGMQIGELKTASVIQAPTDISDGAFDKLNQGGKAASDKAAWGQLGGLYVYDNKLLGTAWAYYDASQTNGFRSHFTANLNWQENTGFSGLHTVGKSPTGSIANGGFVGGYMTQVPQKYRAELGFPMLTGRTGGPIVGRSSFGPTLWGFDPGTLNFDTPAPATMFIGYPESQATLGNYSDQISLSFNRSTGVTGVVWPENSDSILFFGAHGLGIAFNPAGIPLNNTAEACTGPGTSDTSEAIDNATLKSSGIKSKSCGFYVLNEADINSGLSCCYDPINNTNTTHRYDFQIGSGTSCYGPGTRDYKEARTSAWLKQNAAKAYTCGGYEMQEEEITQDNACCFVGTNSVAKGGSSYPSVYQVWQYDVQDILDVKANRKAPWDVVPRIWNFDLPFDSTEKAKQIQATAYDAANQRIFIAQAFGDGNYPLIHVFEVDLENSPPKGIKNFNIQLR